MYNNEYFGGSPCLNPFEYRVSFQSLRVKKYNKINALKRAIPTFGCHLRAGVANVYFFNMPLFQHETT